MKNLRKLLAPLSIVLLSVTVFTSCKKDDPIVTPPPATDIVSVAVANGSFKTLAAALTKAGLVSTLQGAGPYTVFAPSDAAFTKAGITSLDALTADALKPILLYHVLGVKVLAAGIAKGQTEVATAGGPKMYITNNANGVFINGNTKVVTTDVAASNGVIHVLDNVLTDIPSKTIAGIVSDNKDFSTLLTLVKAAGLVDALSSPTIGYTVFAPTNKAFEGVDASKLTVAQIKQILLYHVVPSRVFSPELSNGDVTMADDSKSKVTIDLTNGATVKGVGNTTASKITATNIMATNGVIHVIDRVLLPKL
jgi:uncharacterized surface protein with fasciclin (FAS1) repeats